MTKLALSTRFGFAAIVLAALPSVAGAVRPKVPVPTPSGREAAMLKKYDLNHNGVIDPFERRRMLEAQKAEMEDRFDANHNGKLGPVEQMTARRYRVEKLISILDSNRDGFISYREARVRTGSNLVERFTSIDSNHDRLLSKRELLATPYVGVPLRPRHPWWSWWTASG